MSSPATLPSSPLSIAVVGAGGIGSMFAGYLARAGHAVTVVARPGSPRLQQLQRDNGIVLKSGEQIQTTVLDRLDEHAEYELVLVTLLAHQVEAVLPALVASRAQAIQFMMNMFAPERIADALGTDRCSFGMPFVMAKLDPEGVLDASASGQKTLHGDQRWATLFTQAGIPSAFEPQMALWLRCHLPVCVAMESIAYKAKQRDAGATWAQSMLTARGLHGGFALVQASGVELYPAAKRYMNAAPDVVLGALFWGLTRNTKFRELLATGVKECRALIDLVGAPAGTRPATALQAFLAMKP